MSGILVFSIAGLVFTAVIISPISDLFGHKLIGGELITVWGIVALGVAAVIYVQIYRQMYYSLYPDGLHLGRGNAGQRIPFDDIQSIVLSLPEKMSWWIRIQRFNPKGRSVYHNQIQARKLTLLIRLKGHRYLPLNLLHNYMQDGEEFMTKFLIMNQARVVGRESYTLEEVDGLASIRFNAIKVLPHRTPKPDLIS